MASSAGSAAALVLGIAEGDAGIVWPEAPGSVIGAVWEYVPGAVIGAGCGRTIGPEVLGMADGLAVVGDCAQAGIAARTPAAKANAFRLCFISETPQS